ncbi:MAG: DNA primase [Betaproteobacteria bacterium]|nr:DNA primase [Betaproteobacteria bacterium]
MVNEEFQEAIAKLDIESWMDREGVRYRVTRGARGTQLNVKECPCCGNANWKVYINQETGLGNCFSGDCEKKFNKWSFIRTTFGGMSNGDVVRHIEAVAKEQGWRPSRRAAVATNLNSELNLPASYPLPICGRNLKYLDNRGITARIAKYFGLRFSKHGVFRYKDEEGRDRVQDYSNRIILPVFDLLGDLVSFQGRDITGAAEKKYLFPPGFASTGSHLYNGQNAHGAKSIVIGEGGFDVMALKIALDGDMDLRDVVPVGSFGKHLSRGDDDSQLAKLMVLREEGLRIVTFMWDGEDRAISDAIEAGLLLRRYGFTARIAVLPKDRDPNEVAPSVVRDAFWRAEVVNENVAVRLRVVRRAA